MTKMQTLNERLACCASGGGIVPNRKLVADAQSRIADLEAEVEDARERLRLAVKSADLADAAIDTAWNDAIEAAAAYCDSKSHTPEDVREPEYYIAVGHEFAANAIRALKR